MPLYCYQCPAELSGIRIPPNCPACGAIFGRDPAWAPRAQRSIFSQASADSSTDIASAAVVSAGERDGVVAPARPGVLSVLLNLVGRLVLWAIGSVVGMAIVLLSAMPYGGGREALTLASCSSFALFAWAWLPVIRLSKIAFGVLIAAWAGFGIFLWDVGAPHVRGWMLIPWAGAIVAVIVALVSQPPAYLQTRRDSGAV